jgi:hypothetical protein
VLAEVVEWHALLRSVSRKGDKITSLVLDIVDKQMLLSDPSERIAARNLVAKLDTALNESLAESHSTPKETKLIASLQDLDLRLAGMAPEQVSTAGRELRPNTSLSLGLQSSATSNESFNRFAIDAPTPLPWRPAPRSSYVRDFLPAVDTSFSEPPPLQQFPRRPTLQKQSIVEAKPELDELDRMYRSRWRLKKDDLVDPLIEKYIFDRGQDYAIKRLEEEIDKRSQMEKGDKACVQHLRLTDPRDDKKRIEETKGGLLEDSYHWILEHSDFRRWRDDDENRLLWIKGDPGKGKTMLLCGIIDELKKSNAKTSLGYFFCQATDSRINNATAVLRGLIYLLVDQQPSLISHIRKKYDHAGKSLFEDANAWIALVEIITNILRDPTLNSTYLIIDALDECVADLPKLLDFLFQTSSVSPRVKWVVSSRNWPNIEERLETAGHKVGLCLELNAESVSTAVEVYIQHKTMQLAKLKKYDKNTRLAVLQHLTSNANNTFLWVALVCQNLKSIPRWKTLAKLDAFPPGLSSLYERMLEQLYRSEEANLCKQILALTAVLYRPITLEELTSLVEMLEDTSDDLESLREIVGLCGSFLTVREGTVYFVHQSAKDYLLAKAVHEIFPCGIGEAHHLIFSRSLQIMPRTLRRDMYDLYALGCPIERVKTPDPDPLATSRYSCVYWIDHLCDSNPNACPNYGADLQDGGAVDLFLRKTYLYWLEALSLCRSMSNGLFSTRKLEALIQVMLWVETLGWLRLSGLSLFDLASSFLLVCIYL